MEPTIFFTPRWDGSFLGTYDTRTIIYRKAPYWFIQLNGWSGWVSYQINDDGLPQLIDEIKPYFGLLKRGSHGLNIGKRHYTIYYVPTQPIDRSIQSEIMDLPTIIDDFPINPIYLHSYLTQIKLSQLSLEEIELIRRAFLFREICGLKPNSPSALIFYDQYISTVHDRRTVNQVRDWTLSNLQIQKWFMSKSQNIYEISCLEDEFHKLTQLAYNFYCSPDEVEDLAESTYPNNSNDQSSVDWNQKINKIVQGIEQQIERISPRLVWFSNFIQTRLSSRLGL